MQAKNFVIATGVRPRDYSAIPELKQHAITSDDLFSLKENPGKTLIVGGGYIAIECAGFLRGLGNEVILVNRSTFLRVFDEDMARKVNEQMEEEGVKLMTQTNIKSVRKVKDREFEVELVTNKKDTSKVTVNTILVAIGRDSNPESYAADKAKIQVDKASKKIVGRLEEPERTSIDHIYAIGDVVMGVPELQPVAQKSGKLLAHRVAMRLKQQHKEDEILRHWSTDYKWIPSTVFSPTEYSYVGLNEREAVKQYGEPNIEIYHREVTPLQYSVYKENTRTAYMKVIVDVKTDKVLGIHYFGPNAEEVMNGFAVAMRLGVTKRDLDRTIGIHPSSSEDMFALEVTKRSGEDYKKSEC